MADGLTNVWLDKHLLLLAVLKFPMLLSKLNAHHFQVALVKSLQLVHNENIV